MARGSFIIVMGPTGSGKSVLMQHVREQFPTIKFLKSYTTRARRSAFESEDYVFLEQPAFDKMVEEGAFIEWARFGSGSYATSKADIEEALASGTTLIKEMEVQGIRQILAQLPRDEVKIIYIDAGSWEELERRVRARAPITEEELAKRKQRYDDEFPFKAQADVVIENLPGKLEEAKAALTNAILSIQGEKR
jgi:guanylate kinase